MTKIYTAQAQLKETHHAIPRGIIIAYSGPSIPSGWLLCNGTLGTPDLTDRFIIGDTAVGTGTAGGTQSMSGLTHAGFALANHSNHVVTQPNAHPNHVVTQPAAHSNHVFTQPGDEAFHSSLGGHTHSSHTADVAGSLGVANTKLTGVPTTHSTDGAHSHGATSSHVSGAVDAHSAHAGFAVDAHSAHTGFGVDAHSVHGITQTMTHNPKTYTVAYIMKM